MRARPWNFGYFSHYLQIDLDRIALDSDSIQGHGEWHGLVLQVVFLYLAQYPYREWHKHFLPFVR